MWSLGYYYNLNNPTILSLNESPNDAQIINNSIQYTPGNIISWSMEAIGLYQICIGANDLFLRTTLGSTNYLSATLNGLFGALANLTHPIEGFQAGYNRSRGGL